MSAQAPIEHGAGRIGGANAAVLDAITVAYRQVLAIAEDGFAVLAVHIERGRPVVEIRPGGRCRHLHGVCNRSGIESRGRYRRMVSLKYPGVQVRWTEWGH